MQLRNILRGNIFIYSWDIEFLHHIVPCRVRLCVWVKCVCVCECVCNPSRPGGHLLHKSFVRQWEEESVWPVTPWCTMGVTVSHGTYRTPWCTMGSQWAMGPIGHPSALWGSPWAMGPIGHPGVLWGSQWAMGPVGPPGALWESQWAWHWAMGPTYRTAHATSGLPVNQLGLKPRTANVKSELQTTWD